MSGQRALAPPDWCSHAVEVGWLTAAVAVPLIFNPWGGSAFELPKAAVLRALVLLMGVAALVGTIERWDGARRAPRWWLASPLLTAAAALGLALTLATVLSVNPRIGLWGSYERQQGLLSLWAYVILFLLTATGLRSRAQVERLWMALVWGSAPIVIYGLLQAAGLDPVGWRTDAASPVLSTVGRANFLGSYLVLIVPLTAGRAMLARRHWLYVPLLVGQLLCLALTQARGAWVGLGVGTVVFGVVWATVTRDHRFALAVLAGATLVVGLVVLLNWADGPLAALASLPGLDRVSTLARTDEGSTAARLTTWRATIPLIVARPWLGYGPETMRTVFARVFPPQLVYYQGRRVAVDRAHNLWMDLGMSAGLVGVVAFGALLVGFARLAWSGLRSSSDRWAQVAWVVLVAAIAGHVADLQFGFHLTTSATIFWLTLALGAALGCGLSPSAQEKAASPKLVLLLPYAGPALAVLSLVGLLCVRPVAADVAYWRSQQNTRPLEGRLATARQAVYLWPLEPEYRLGLAWVLVQAGSFAAAEAEVTGAHRLSPDDPRIWAAQGELYTRWGEVDPGRYLWGEVAYRQALELAPNVATYHMALGLALAAQGRPEEGLIALERAVALDATDAVAYGHLADLYLSLGREAEAAWAHQQEARWSSRGGGDDGVK